MSDTKAYATITDLTDTHLDALIERAEATRWEVPDLNGHARLCRLIDHLRFERMSRTYDLVDSVTTLVASL